eukprot:CAMPEP_0201577008 /NCGR_PEP_ID=MMETSP0190_2-20130828/23165_1 /ASSEMBLY_ACC=CAM_ASM_000263 /TAXON_ID=37353 /ORGANISM="Rosalina sp." /LENGTH=238 /DNA_ID=CAMNT_0048008559 /DNA_START=20 /DNA_END=736 /DNA_ORIENTATION=-
MVTFFSLFVFCFVNGWSFPIALSDTQDLGVYYSGNVSNPFSYLRATITIPSSPLPSLDNQYVYYYFGLSKQTKLAAHGMVLFCGYKDGCYGGSIETGYSIYAALRTDSNEIASGAKISIQPGETAEVTIVQNKEYLEVNVTKISDGLQSYFSINGANDGGLFDITAGVNLQYQSNQADPVCDDYNKQPYIISDIVASESGVRVNPIDFKQDANQTNSCGGTIDIGSNGETLTITGSKS